MPKTNPQRRRQLVKKGLQLRLAWSHVAVALLAVLLQTILHGFFLAGAADEFTLEGHKLLQLLPGLLWRSVLCASLFLVPLTGLFAILGSFRIAGPLHRIELYLQDVARGEEPGPCTVRDEDELQELCTLVNEALTTARAKQRPAVEAEEPARAA